MYFIEISCVISNAFQIYTEINKRTKYLKVLNLQ